MAVLNATFKVRAHPLCACCVAHRVAAEQRESSALHTMITVSPSASAALAELLDEADILPHLMLRVVANEVGQCDLSLEPAELDDTVFNHRGRNFLAIEPTAARLLDGTTLDL